ncbi:hypothetical protein ACWC5I_03525 [Kitasatospora sp. NPDC001574]
MVGAMERREHPSKLVHHYTTDGTPIGPEQTGTGGKTAGTGTGTDDEEGGN